MWGKLCCDENEMADTGLTMRLVLASGSPRRRELLARAGLKFDVVVPPLDEPDESHAQLPPASQAEARAYFKARCVADRNPDAIVVGADTIVALDKRVLGKPTDDDDARRILTELSGTRHRVITGLALCGPQGQRLISYEITYVTMRKMSESDIQSYIDSGEWKDKAGAYAIQETADRYIESLEGSFTNVVGLPMELLQRMLQLMLREFNAHLEAREGG